MRNTSLLTLKPEKDASGYFWLTKKTKEVIMIFVFSDFVKIVCAF